MIRTSDKKILLLSEIFPPTHGGSGRWFWEIYRRLSRNGVALLVGEHTQSAEFDAQHNLELTRAPLALSRWGMAGVRSSWGYLKQLRRLQKHVRQHDISELHVGRCLPEGWLAWLLKKTRGIPYSCYVHGEDVETAATSRELTWIVRRVLNNANMLIANSHNSASLLTGRWDVPEERIQVLHPGVDTQLFCPAPPSGTERQALGWCGRTVVLTVGRLQQRKGQDMLIRGLPKVKEVLPDILYSIIGGGEDRERLQRLACEQQVEHAVQFLDEVNDETMKSCYQQCDLFALPNRQVGNDIEGFGMVLLEAQACGTPVLAGRSGGTAETMNVGETGVVIPCEAPETLASALIELLLDPHRLGTMGQAGRRWVEEQFDWNSLASTASKLFGVPLQLDTPLRNAENLQRN